MVIKRTDTDVFSPDKNTSVHHYLGISDYISVAETKVNGRHPVAGFFINEVCNSVIYVLEGKGSIFINGEEFVIQAGDCVNLEKNKKYYFNGVLTILYLSSPPFYVEQNLLRQ